MSYISKSSNNESAVTASAVTGDQAAHEKGPSAFVVSTSVDSASGFIIAAIEVKGFPADTEVELGQCATNLAQQTVCSDHLVRVRTDDAGAAIASIPVSEHFTGRDITTIEQVDVDCAVAGTVNFVVATAFTTNDAPTLIRADAPLTLV